MILEDYFTKDSDEETNWTDAPVDRTNSCWLFETFVLVESCIPCTEFDKVQKQTMFFTASKQKYEKFLF